MASNTGPAGNAQTRPCGLSALPEEILDMIIPSFDAPSTVCFALTCRRLYCYTLSEFRCNRLDDICPKDPFAHAPRRLVLYGLGRYRIPHYRDPFMIFDYAKDLDISRESFNPAYIQLMLCLRSFMAPRYVFCFARRVPGYVRRKGRHVCPACQKERWYLAQHELHLYALKVKRFVPLRGSCH